MISQIVKRDGRVTGFDQDKITTAIFKACRATGNPDHELAQKLSDKAVELLEQRFTNSTPTVEEVQDVVETVLISSGEAKVAKAYILYRQKRKELRDLKKSILQGRIDEETDLSLSALKILEKRFLKKNSAGKLLETPSQMFRRVAANIAQADAFYGKNPEVNNENFFQAMRNLEFLPATPVLLNAGTPVQQLASSFVLPIDDSIEGIFDAIKHAAIIHKTGGGTGFSFSKLRPKNDVVTGKGLSSGPLSFLKLFDAATEIVKAGGVQRGANMGVLRVDHPDILEFINLKADGKSLTNFNLSVGITDVFMEAVLHEREYQLINPRTGEPVNAIPARSVFDTIVAMAWQRGDPGMIFLDRINKDNPLKEMGSIESTDSCGEQPLLSYESSPLGSINLNTCVKNNSVDWDKLRELVHLGIQFLDNTIDMTNYPLKEIEHASLGSRKIGLGIMGFADMLYQLGIPYDSEEGIQLAEKLMRFIRDEALAKSISLSEERGDFAFWSKSVYEQKGLHVRNATRLTIAPTGTISMIADTSPGLEPNFAISYVKNIMGDTELVYVNKHFSRVAKKRGFYSDDLMRTIADTGSVQHIPGIPEDVKRVFVTAQDISPEWHIRMQAAFQKYVDNGIAKTINVPSSASLRDVEQCFLLAWKLGCKGITVYRDRSLDAQVISIPHRQGEREKEEKPLMLCKECSAVIPARTQTCMVCGSTVVL